MDNRNKKIEEMMNLLDELPKTQASPGFFQRTNYRLIHEKEETKEPLFTNFFRFALTPALIGASIVFGIFIGMVNNTSYNSSGIDAIVEVYNMETSETQQIFNIEN